MPPRSRTTPFLGAATTCPVHHRLPDRIAVGEDTAYTVTVRNEGEEAAPELLVAQIAPAHLDLREADGGGVIEDNTAAWLVSLGPGEEQTAP